MTKFTGLGSHEDEITHDDYKGGKGWVIVAMGWGDRGCILESDPKFGALRYMIDQGGIDDISEFGFDHLPEQGVFRAECETWTTSVHDYDGSDNDMGFTVLEPGWVDMFPEGIEKHPIEKVEPDAHV